MIVARHFRLPAESVSGSPWLRVPVEAGEFRHGPKPLADMPGERR
jgi:hypothetical protein